MTHYRSNLRDLEFNLFELLDREAAWSTSTFDTFTRSLARDLLRSTDELTCGVIADSFVPSDHTPLRLDPATETVNTAPEFAAAVEAWLDAEMWRMRLPVELGGTPGPPSLVWAIEEMFLGANPVVWVYTSLASAARVIWECGTDRGRALARLMVDRRWAATMMMTEPEVGSDVGSIRTRATPNDDGTWNIVGTKRFITAAEQSMSENIVHMVLARPQGVPGAGGPGTKGLSMFLVPKFPVDLATGEVSTVRNGVVVTGLESKMGTTASATCSVTFGEDAPTRGWLLGDVHDGIRQMFRVIEDARMMVGTKAMATASTGYLNALEYARARHQGTDMRRAGDPEAPRIPIVDHPDVLRSLLLQKATAEGMRSLVLFTAARQDTVAAAAAAGEDDISARHLNDILLPVVKAYCSERAWQVLGSESLQTLGGSGFLKDFPIEQYVRDTKLDTLYEGTTAIQAMDLVVRKILGGRRKAFGALLDELDVPVIRTEGPDTEIALFAEAVRALRETVELLDDWWPDAASEDPHNLGESAHAVGFNATRFLLSLGDILLSWLLLRSAVIASARRAEGATDPLYEGKIRAASFFCRSVLPHVGADLGVTRSVGSTYMTMDVNAL